MFDITENTKLISFQHPIDCTGTAIVTEWVSMKNAEKATFIIDYGVVGSSSHAVTIAVARDTSGTAAKSISSASVDLGLTEIYTTSGDTFTRSTAIVASSVATVPASFDSTIVVLEVKAEDLGNLVSTSVSYPVGAIRLNAAAHGASCLRSAICILTGLRYQQDSPPTAL